MSTAIAIKDQNVALLGCDSKIVGYSESNNLIERPGIDKWIEIPERKRIFLFAGKLIRAKSFNVEDYRTLLSDESSMRSIEGLIRERILEDLRIQLLMMEAHDKDLFVKHFANEIVFEFIFCGFENDQPLVLKATFMSNYADEKIGFVIFPFHFPGASPLQEVNSRRAPCMIGVHANASLFYEKHAASAINERDLLSLIENSILHEAKMTSDSVGGPVHLWKIDKDGLFKI